MVKRKFFDTDGIRGVTNTYPMVVDVALRIGKAVAFVLAKGKKKPRVIIGKDTRLSGYMFETALTAGLCSMGTEVLLVGPIPTPGIAHLTKSFAADAGIMITASHNPAEHNGIKIFSSDGFKLPDKIEIEIEEYLEEKEIDSKHISGEKIGKARRISDARGRYIEFLKGCINNMPLSGMKIVLDCANGAAYNISPHIFAELGAETVILNNNPDGNNINKECGALYPEVIKSAVLGHEADIGIALDGDADRAIMVDEKGNEVDGDHIMAIIALYLNKKNKLKNSTVVTTVMTNKGFDIAMKKNGIKVLKTKVGDRYVLEKMLEEGLNFGGEQSGHVINLDYLNSGDGTLTALQILKIMKEEKTKLSKLAGCMDSLPQVMINIKVKEKKEIESMSSVMENIKKTESELGDKGRVLVRYSGTEMKARVMVEGENEEEINKYCKDIANAIKKEAGE